MSSIQGIGVDVVDVDRMKLTLDLWGNKLLEKVFTATEISYCRSKRKPHEHFAARFAAKEAVSKALQTGWRETFRWQDVEVVNNPETGAPRIILYNRLSTLLSNQRIHLSLSHSKNTVVAFVLIEKLD